MAEKSEPKGFRHVRESKNFDVKTNGMEKVESHWQERLKGRDPLEVMATKEKIDGVTGLQLSPLDPYICKIRDEKYGWKYRCGTKGCIKLFHAAEFVHKHLKCNIRNL